jgi:post-segregation antitoxin (ccd killing protein)
MSIARGSKKAVNVSISAELLEAARDKDINLSAALEAVVEHELKQFRNPTCSSHWQHGLSFL